MIYTLHAFPHLLLVWVCANYILFTQDDGGKFKIPSKLLPHSESTTSLYSLSGDTQGSVSDWEDSVDFPEWEELSADDEDGNLSGGRTNSTCASLFECLH